MVKNMQMTLFRVSVSRTREQLAASKQTALVPTAIRNFFTSPLDLLLDCGLKCLLRVQTKPTK
jgi:hypothetical protein